MTIVDATCTAAMVQALLAFPLFVKYQFDQFVLVTKSDVLLAAAIGSVCLPKSILQDAIRRRRALYLPQSWFVAEVNSDSVGTGN